MRRDRVPGCRLDHITVTAPSLAVGAAFVQQALGVMPQAGGTHARMGTHNLLLRLGDAQFIEVIAPDPEAPSPARARWFGLDRLCPDSPPRLAAWVARTTDIRATLAACPETLGKVERMSRGEFSWRMTIPVDGTLPLAGVAPVLIEWDTEIHPASRLDDLGFALAGFELFHPEPERITRLLQAIGIDFRVAVSPIAADRAPCLVAHVDTPQGPRRLAAPD